MNNELLEQVSFTLDLLNLDRKLDCKDPSVDDQASTSVYVVEEALRAKGVRPPVDKKQK
jgi:FAD/FMN-containing dehydrogenase